MNKATFGSAVDATSVEEVGKIDTRQVDCILVSDGVYKYVYSDTKEPVPTKEKGE